MSAENPFKSVCRAISEHSITSTDIRPYRDNGLLFPGPEGGLIKVPWEVGNFVVINSRGEITHISQDIRAYPASSAGIVDFLPATFDSEAREPLFSCSTRILYEQRSVTYGRVMVGFTPSAGFEGLKAIELCCMTLPGRGYKQYCFLEMELGENLHISKSKIFQDNDKGRDELKISVTDQFLKADADKYQQVAEKMKNWNFTVEWDPQFGVEMTDTSSGSARKLHIGMDFNMQNIISDKKELLRAMLGSDRRPVIPVWAG